MLQKYLYFLIFFMICQPSFVNSAELCHIANAGFYVSDGSSSVLFDALFADGLEGYATATKQLEEKLENAEEPFDNVKMIVVTHFHDDHMKPAPIIKHLSSNPKAVGLMTEQAYNILKDDNLSENNDHRIMHITPFIGTQHSYIDLPFPTTVFGISHGEKNP
ncbi:MAG TPA: hypothetical protein P5227_05435, partial [Emcibacteraceae bacterium]|nr:hypothetical protein [Emcibacteraceae bacterium]